MQLANAHELTGTLDRPRFPRDAEHWALWLDLDQTIVESTRISPEGRLDIHVVSLLGRLREQLDGAVAVLSSRSIDQIDRLCAPLKLPAGALYGAQLRDARGQLTVASANCEANAMVASKCKLAGRLLREVSVEQKGDACHALRFPAHARIAAQVRDFVDAVVAASNGAYEVRFAPGVALLKPAGPSHSRYLHELSRHPPFAGRRPVALGYQATDDATFDAAIALGGFGVIVGPGRQTRARYCLEDADDAIAWLRALSRRLDWA